MRDLDQPVSGHELAKILIHFSERGEAYVKSLHAIMRVNKLAQTDFAYLSNEPAVYLVPYGKDSD